MDKKGRIRQRLIVQAEFIHPGLDTKRHSVASHLPLRANSIDLMAVVLLVPVVTLKEATSSWVFVFNTRICNNRRGRYDGEGKQKRHFITTFLQHKDSFECKMWVEWNVQCVVTSFYFIWWKLLHRCENWRFLAFNDMKDATRFYIGTKGSTFLFLLKNLWPLMFCHCKINIFLCHLEVQRCDWKMHCG